MLLDQRGHIWGLGADAMRMQRNGLRDVDVGIGQRDHLKKTIRFIDKTGSSGQSGKPGCRLCSYLFKEMLRKISERLFCGFPHC